MRLPCRTGSPLSSFPFPICRLFVIIRASKGLSRKNGCHVYTIQTPPIPFLGFPKQSPSWSKWVLYCALVAVPSIRFQEGTHEESKHVTSMYPSMFCLKWATSLIPPLLPVFNIHGLGCSRSAHRCAAFLVKGFLTRLWPILAE